MQIAKRYGKPSKTVSRISNALKNIMAQIYHPFLILRFTEVLQCWILLDWQYVFLYIFNCTYLQIVCTSSSHLGSTGNQCGICKLVLVKLSMITLLVLCKLAQVKFPSQCCIIQFVPDSSLGGSLLALRYQALNKKVSLRLPVSCISFSDFDVWIDTVVSSNCRTQ